jgi:hypothetical protein
LDKPVGLNKWVNRVNGLTELTRADFLYIFYRENFRENSAEIFLLKMSGKI